MGLAGCTEKSPKTRACMSEPVRPAVPSPGSSFFLCLSLFFSFGNQLYNSIIPLSGGVVRWHLQLVPPTTRFHLGSIPTTSPSPSRHHFYSLFMSSISSQSRVPSHCLTHTRTRTRQFGSPLIKRGPNPPTSRKVCILMPQCSNF